MSVLQAVQEDPDEPQDLLAGLLTSNKSSLRGTNLPPKTLGRQSVYRIPHSRELPDFTHSGSVSCLPTQQHTSKQAGRQCPVSYSLPAHCVFGSGD